MPRWILLLKVVGAPIGVVLLCSWLADEAALSGIGDASALLFLALLVNQVALSLFALRMQRVLRVFGIGIGPVDAHRIHFQSLFYYFFVPMSVGLEIARYLKIRRVVPDLRQADLIAALLSDRLLGVLVAGTVVLASLPFVRLQRLETIAVNLGWLMAAAVTVAIGGVALLAVWRLGLFSQLIEAWRVTRGRWNHLGRAFLVGTLMQGAMGLTVYLGGTAFGIDVGLPGALFAVAAGTFAMFIPVSVLGIGPAEAVGVATFVLVGLPVSDAAFLASIAYAAKLIGALQGGGWEAVDGGQELFSNT